MNDWIWGVNETHCSEESCRDFLATQRWNGQPECPHCGNIKTYELKKEKRFKCSKCRRQFSVRAGTFLQGSKVPLTKWFQTIRLAGSSGKGISSVALSREIGVTQKTAWLMLQRIRKEKMKRSDHQSGGKLSPFYSKGKEKSWKVTGSSFETHLQELVRQKPEKKKKKTGSETIRKLQNRPSSFFDPEID
jgi:transposase-like protein